MISHHCLLQYDMFGKRPIPATRPAFVVAAHLFARSLSKAIIIIFVFFARFSVIISGHVAEWFYFCLRTKHQIEAVAK